MARGTLVIPEPGERTVATLVRKVRLLAARSLLVDPWNAGPRTAEARAALETALRRSPDDALAAVGSPDVLAPVLARKVDPGAATLSDAIPALLASLVARRALADNVVWAAPFVRVVDVVRGTVHTCDPPARVLLATPSGIEVEGADGRRAPLSALPAARPFTPITESLHLSAIDTNPLALREEHPDKHGNAVDLGGREPSVWVGALAQALELVRAALPTWADELPQSLARVVPVGFEPEKHLSASYREAPGLAYLTLHPDPLTMAEAIVHETQHGKLNLLTWLDPVLHNGHSFWTESPVRPDLRPLMGVMLAVHAFVPVAVMHRRLAELGHPIAASARFAERRAEVIESNARGLATLREHAEPTPIGARILEDLGAASRAAGSVTSQP